MTPRLLLQHSLEGTIRACGQLKELRKEEANQSSLPTQVQIVKKLHKMETAMYNQHAEVARWMMELIKIGDEDV